MSAEHINDTKGGDHDIESQLGGGLSRQMSVQLTAEQFERLYLQPGGTAAKGDAAKRYGNPTPLGVASFLLCLTPFSAFLMGWAGTSTGAAVPLIGAFYFLGGFGLALSGLLEWIVGNTFPATVFITFAGFWASVGMFLQPSQGIAAAVGAASIDYNHGFALYLASWGVLTFIYLIAALRTNVIFVGLFFFLDITFWLLVTAYLNIGYGNVSNIVMILQAAGSFGFLTTVCGWYLMVVLTFGSTGMPIALPVGDLSGFLAGKPHQA